MTNPEAKSRAWNSSPPDFFAALRSTYVYEVWLPGFEPPFRLQPIVAPAITHQENVSTSHFESKKVRGQVRATITARRNFKFGDLGRTLFIVFDLIRWRSRSSVCPMLAHAPASANQRREVGEEGRGDRDWPSARPWVECRGEGEMCPPRGVALRPPGRVIQGVPKSLGISHQIFLRRQRDCNVVSR